MPEIKDFPVGALTDEDVIAAQRPSTGAALGLKLAGVAAAVSP